MRELGFLSKRAMKLYYEDLSAIKIAGIDIT
jgi:hypothetical protein